MKFSKFNAPAGCYLRGSAVQELADVLGVEVPTDIVRDETYRVEFESESEAREHAAELRNVTESIMASVREGNPPAGDDERVVRHAGLFAVRTAKVARKPRKKKTDATDATGSKSKKSAKK